MITKEEKKLIIEIEKLKKENKVIKNLSTNEGFFKEYFNNLKNYKSKEDAFNYVNNLYEKYFGEKKYLTFKGFDSLY